MQAMRLTCLAVALAACTTEPVPSEISLDTAALTPPIEEDPCPINGCGGNSPVVGGVYFWRLHLGGQANPEGVKIVNVHKGAMVMDLAVVGDELRGVDPGNPATILAQGSTLIGTVINLSVKGLPYEVLIDFAAPSETFWVAPPAEQIWRYRFKYRPVGGGGGGGGEAGPRAYKPMCSEGDGDPTKLDAMVFRGDIYNPVTKRITLGLATHDWANIACADSALYKMHRVGYTTAAENRLGIDTTRDQRQAMLNAWTANVCGKGQAFTNPGEELLLRESLGVFHAAPYNAWAAGSTVEAIWGPRGAVCLDTARLEEHDEKIYDKIEEACGGELPPSCATLPGTWTGHGSVITGNP